MPIIAWFLVYVNNYMEEKSIPEIAEELGLLEKVEQFGWKGLTSRESGRIGGIMGKRKKQEKEKKDI